MVMFHQKEPSSKNGVRPVAREAEIALRLFTAVAGTVRMSTVTHSAAGRILHWLASHGVDMTCAHMHYYAGRVLHNADTRFFFVYAGTFVHMMHTVPAQVSQPPLLYQPVRY